MRKTRLIRAFLDDAKHEGLGIIAAKMIAPAAAARAAGARNQLVCGDGRRNRFGIGPLRHGA